jgi:hypothetical protein
MLAVQPLFAISLSLTLQVSVACEPARNSVARHLFFPQQPLKRHYLLIVNRALFKVAAPLQRDCPDAKQLPYCASKWLHGRYKKKNKLYSFALPHTPATRW